VPLACRWGLVAEVACRQAAAHTGLATLPTLSKQLLLAALPVEAGTRSATKTFRQKHPDVMVHLWQEAQVVVEAPGAVQFLPPLRAMHKVVAAVALLWPLGQPQVDCLGSLDIALAAETIAATLKSYSL